LETEIIESEGSNGDSMEIEADAKWRLNFGN
jgi:hypothetical protein